MAAAPKDLITIARAYQNLNGVTGVDTLIQTLVTAYSEAIEKYCRRYFVSRAFDELYSGDGDRRLMLRQYPIQSVLSVRYRQVTVLKIINNNVLQNQQARVQVTSTGLQLTRTASGVPVTETLITWAGNVTLNAVATAVNGFGNGWVAQIVGDPGGSTGDYGLWPSADLYMPPSFGDGVTSQGNLSARQVYAELKMHTYELQGWQFDARGWLLRSIPYTDPELLHPEDMIWPVGVNNFRVQYTAGYTTIPEAVQEACARWVSYAYWETQRDPALIHQVPASGTTSGWGSVASRQISPPKDVLALLAPYRRFSVGVNQS
jgi:hypothetical protein